MIRLVGSTSRRELLITLAIWAALLLGAVVALFALRSRSVDIINNIYYVNVTRGSKAGVLYLEAEKYARKALAAYEDANRKSVEQVLLPADNPDLKRSLSLYEQAMTADARPVFSPERTKSYEIVAQLQESVGNTTAQLLAQAQALMTVGDTPDAVSAIEKARAASPASPEPLTLLAEVQLETGDRPAAQAALDELYTSSTVTPRARWIKGRLLMAENQYKEAVHELEQAIKAQPDSMDVRVDLARSQELAGDKKAAAKTMEQGLSDGGWMDPAYLHTYSGYLLDLNDIDEAVRVLVQADKLAPYSGDVQFSLAQAYNKAGKRAQAAAALRRATEVKPELQDHLLQ